MDRWWMCLAVVVSACGSSSSGHVPDAAVVVDAPDMGGCTAGGACTTNPGAPCRAGKLMCAMGQPTCVDDAPVTDGTACPAGLCTRGACYEKVTVSSPIDLSTMMVSAGRTCEESPTYSITGLTATTAQLPSSPLPGCLAAGDEVLVINLQGAPGAITNVGNWQLLTIASLAGTTVTFTTAKTVFFGATANSDAGVGIGLTDQKVALVRVGQFGDLTVNASGSLTTGRWNGLRGGVIAIRASALNLTGTITASGLGYHGGKWSEDGLCSGTVTTEPGESIAGTAAASTTASFGAPGGVGAANGISFNGNTPLNSGASHATAGQAGSNGNGRTIGAPGGVYGVADASKLTLGSGQSGNMTCNTGFGGPALITVDEPLAGGIVLLLPKTLSVGATGKITASAATASRDVSGSGGYVYIEGDSLFLGAQLVTAVGGIGNGANATAGQSVKSGDGYIVVKGKTVSGTTVPAAHQL